MNRKKLKELSVVVCYLSLVLVVLGAWGLRPTGKQAMAAEKIVLTTETGNPPAMDQTWGRTGKPWTEAVTKRTNGTVQFKSHFAGELASMIDLMRALGSGMVNVGVPYLGYYPSEFALETYLGSLTHPSFTLGDAERIIITRVLYSEIPAFAEAYKKNNLKKIFSVSCTSWQVLSRVPISTLKDFKGVKIRTFGTYIPKMLRAVGAVPVTVPFSEVVDALQKKVADGTFGNLANFYDLKVYEVAKHIVFLGVKGIPGHVVPYSWAMNLNDWNKLPVDIKRIMLEEGKRVEMEYGNYSFTEQMIAVKEMEKRGCIRHTLSDSDLKRWAELCGDFQSEVSKELDGKGLPGTETMAYIKKLSKLPLNELKVRYDKAWEKEFALLK